MFFFSSVLVQQMLQHFFAEKLLFMRLSFRMALQCMESGMHLNFFKTPTHTPFTFLPSEIHDFPFSKEVIKYIDYPLSVTVGYCLKSVCHLYYQPARVCIKQADY